jgi:chitin synthase
LFDISNNSTCYGGKSSVQGIDPFYPSGESVFIALNQLYVVTLMIIFVASLGNRPQGSKAIYITVTIVFAILLLFTFFMGAWTVKVAFDAYYTANAASSISFTSYSKNNPVLQNILIALLTSIGVYIVSSFIHMEPWHCFTCMSQYSIMASFYTNVLMVYSCKHYEFFNIHIETKKITILVCNIHDVSWGTKGDTLATTGGAANISQGPNGEKIAQVEMISGQDGTDDHWKDLVKKLEYHAMVRKEPVKVAALSAATIHDGNFDHPDV